MQEFVKKVRKYHIAIRKAINLGLQGDFRSVFKGSGLDFDQIRAYQFGDDVRNIDWNVTAKGQGVYVKLFKEERQQQVYILLDVSASQQVGTQNQTKLDIAKEVAAVLSLVAAQQGAFLGLMAFSDQTELIIKPQRGEMAAMNCIKKMLALRPNSKQTNLNQAFQVALDQIPKRSLLLLISDFKDQDFLKKMQTVAFKHDLIAIHLWDKVELDLPDLGIIPFVDNETGKKIWVNTSWGRKGFKNDEIQRQLALKQAISRMGADYLFYNTADNLVENLTKLFTRRKYRGKQ